MNLRTLLALITLLSTVSLAGSEMYQWVDDNGVVTFKDAPPPAAKKRSRVRVYNDSDFDAAPPPQPVTSKRSGTSSAGSTPEQPPPSAHNRFTGTVEMYVTDWCPHCREARDYMESRGIPYMAYDIDKDPSANQRYKELGARGVPLIIIGSNRMNGFSPASLEHYLNNSR